MLIKRLSVFLVVTILVLLPYGSARAIETMADYTDYPIFMTNSVTPNVLIVLDNSGSMNSMAYEGNGSYDPNVTYYGYFTSAFNYSYDGTKFNINAAGPWSGNFLNWAAMRRVDVGRKVMMGGLATSRTGGGNQTNIGDSGSGWFVYKWGKNGDAATLAPYVGWDIAYVLWGGDLLIYRNGVGYIDSFNIRIKKDVAQEPGDFVSGNLAGLMQKVENKARWGLEFFNQYGQGQTEGSAQKNDGGSVVQPIVGTGYGVNMITDLQNTPATTWTPLAESMYIAAGYYANDGSMQYKNGNIPTTQNKDPMYYGDLATPQYVPCPKNFVILITDGEPTMDSNIPASPPGAYPNTCVGGSLRDCDGDGNDGAIGWSYQTDYLDDVTLWAHTTDLRPGLTGTQNIDFYMVYAFGNNPTAEQILKNAAKNGAFEDSNGNNLPDIQTEYDKDLDGIPDTYYQASDGASLETELMSAITAILKRSTSGTAISVLATSASGAGNIYQAYFLPSKTIVDASGSRDVNWLGHLLSLNIDANGGLRDNSGACIKFFFDAAQGETFVQNIPESSPGVCDPNGGATGSTPLTSYTGYVWDAGEKLLTKDPTTRNIFTFVDGNKDGLVQVGEVIPFTTANAGALQKYLRTSTVAEATDLINFIRGNDVAGLRDRTVAVSGTDYEWKLGDIVHSTPSVVSSPTEAYGLLYGDASYTSFFNANKNRSIAVYVGANDGMLHAFCGDSAGCGTAADGDEIWSYIPYNLLPHLKWLSDPSYTHVNYVDFKTKISDVMIGGSWKTVLIGGMRMGGGQISDDTYDVDGDGDTPATKLRKWESAYFAFDITDPTNPIGLWEITDPDLGFTMSYPTIAKVGTKWYAVFGSGSQSAYAPDYEGNPDQAAKLFVIDLDKGSIAATFQVSDTTSFFADPVAVDIDFITTTGTDYDIEAIYVAETYYKSTGGGSWNSRMWRLVTFGDPNPANWKMYNFFNPDASQQIVAAPSLANDDNNQQWIYFGTGKYYSDADKSSTDTQSFYGMKDPCWNPDKTNYGWKSPLGSAPGSCTAGSSELTANPTGSVTKTDLINTTSVVVEKGGNIQGGSVTGAANGDTVDNLSDEMVNDTVGNALGGWYVDLPVSGERSLNKPTVAGGLVLFTTFVPNSDLCGFSGDSYFNVLYFTTGTAYKESVIGCAGGDVKCTGGTPIVLSRSETSSTGMASSIAIHMGRETGAQAYVQLSTGEASAIDVNTPPGSTSGIISWRDL